MRRSKGVHIPVKEMEAKMDGWHFSRILVYWYYLRKDVQAGKAIYKNKSIYVHPVNRINRVILIMLSKGFYLLFSALVKLHI